ncbi:MAG: chromate transporter [Sphaerochaetaceae bacterium]
MDDFKNISRKKLFWTLFRSTFTLSAFTFGGGYVIVPLMRKMFVDRYHWIEEQEMLDLIAIAQAAPGPMAVNTSILVGYKIAGIPGALITLLGTVLPPLIILTAFSYIYEAIKDNVIIKTLFYGMNIGVAVVILDAVSTLALTILKQKKVWPILVMIAAFIATYIMEVDIVIIIVCCAVLGVSLTLIADALAKRKAMRTGTSGDRRNPQ